MQTVGRSRDARVLEGLEQFRYLSTPQIAEMYFTTIKDRAQRIKKASERMKRMYDRGYVQRFRFPSEPFIFTVKGNKYSTKMQHYLMLANCWIELQKLKPAGSVLRCEVEKKQEDLITDLIVEMRNNFTNERKLYWIELEHNSHGDIDQKIERYKGIEWLFKANNLPIGQLVVVCTKKATYAKLGGNQVKTVYYPAFPEQWKW